MKLATRAISLFVLAALILYTLGGAIPATAATTLPPPDGSQFLTGPAQGSPQSIALGYIQANRSSLGLSAADLSDYVITDQYTDRITGTTHIYLRQRYQGIEVDGANININVARNGSIINMHSDFVPDLAAAVNTTRPTQLPAQAIESAAIAVGLDTSQPATLQPLNSSLDGSAVYNPGSIPSQPIPVKLVYSIVSPKAVHLAWNVQMNLNSGEHYWSINVDAQDNQVLKQYDYVTNDTWGQAVTDSTAEAQDAASVAGGAAALAAVIGAAPESAAGTMPAAAFTAANKAPTPPAPQAPAAGPKAPATGPTGTYNIYPLPVEAPSFGARSVVTPTDVLASPYGWHDTDGVAGPEYTITRGNNVYAATDLNQDNIPDPGSSPDGSASLTFDFPLDLGQGPETYRPAVVTNLFYWNNIAHDVFYHYGFDELSGSFQQNNYGRGGQGNDPVDADAQDGSGVNNANFGTPPDGASGRMQMYVWTHSTFTLTVQSPAGIAGNYPGVAAAFGPSTFDITGATELATPATGCTAITNNVSGKIAIIDRGTCTFAVKVQNAQNAGATGVIVVDNRTEPPFAMSGAGPTIPSAMVDRDTVGAMLKANVPATLRLQKQPDISRDSDLDSGIMVHEYGHGVSNRLVGGPSNVGCLSNPEQMGEGWSDILALILTARSTYTSTTPIGMGTYVEFQPTNGLGIRPTPYTTSMAVNPATYAMIGAPYVETHDVGYVWTSILWEMYWNLVDKHGFNPDIYGAWNTGGNNLALQLILDGLKLTNCSPGFVDGRNAIIAADTVLTGGQNYCEIWSGFAKRGLGYLASQGSSNSLIDQTADFSLPPSCGPAQIQVAPASLASTPSFTLMENKALQIDNTNAPAGANTQTNSNHAIGQDVYITNVITPTATQGGLFQTTIAVSQTVQLNVRTYGAAAVGTDLDLYVRDALNNVVGSSAGPTDAENVTLILPADGVYTLEVDGYSVPGGSTTFNLATQLIKQAGAGPATYFTTTVAVTTTNALKISTGGSTHASDLSLFVLDNANQLVGSSTLAGKDQESVAISQPTSGTYTIIVFGPSVPTGTDTFDLHVQKISGLGTALTWSFSEAPLDCNSPADIPWVSEPTASGSTGSGLSSFPDVHFDETRLAKGQYTGFLCITTNDPTASLVTVPLTLTVNFTPYFFPLIAHK